MLLLSIAFLLASPAEAAKKKNARAIREAREADIREHMLDEPVWEVEEGNEDRSTLEDYRAGCVENDMAACAALGKAYALGDVATHSCFVM